MKKSAFTLIELIFAIVIIGITVISLPMVNQAVSKGVEGNLVQEAIFAASTELNQVVSYYWDENSMQSQDTLSKVVWTSSNDCNTTTKLRVGHIKQTLHRRCLDYNGSRPSILGSDSGDLDDLDDMNSSTHQIFVNYNSTIDVSYTSFGDVSSADKNIKEIKVTITDSNNNSITSLKTYSSNIGEIDYYKRSYE